MYVHYILVIVVYTITDKEALAQDPNYLPVPSQVHFPGDMTAMQIECGTFHTGMYVCNRMYALCVCLYHKSS